MAACLKKEPRSGRGLQAKEDIWPFIQQLAMTRADRLAGRASSAVKASVNQPTQVLKKSRYIQIRGRNRRRYCIQPREGNHVRHEQDSNLCSVDDGAPKLSVLWGRRPHETLQQLETGRVHDRGYRQQSARKRVRQAGGGLSYIYGCWSRVRIGDHERR